MVLFVVPWLQDIHRTLFPGISILVMAPIFQVIIYGALMPGKVASPLHILQQASGFFSLIQISGDSFDSLKDGKNKAPGRITRCCPDILS